MSSLNKQLEHLVQENIGNVEMGVFQREFERLQKIEAEFVELRETHKKLSLKHKELVSEYELEKVQIDIILEREQLLEIKENEFFKKETQLFIDTQLIDLKKDHSDQRVKDHERMVGLVFRSPVFTKSVIETINKDVVVPIEGYDNSSGYAHKEQINETNSTIIETKET